MDKNINTKNINLVLILIIGFSTLIISVIIILLIVSNLALTYEVSDLLNNGFDTFFNTNGISITLSNEPYSNIEITTKNDTWIDLDGINDFIFTKFNLSISFWYKNETVDWTNVIKSSSNYIDGSVETSGLFPVYNNGSDWIIGNNETDYFKISVDNIGVYNGTINSSTAGEIYNEGR